MSVALVTGSAQGIGRRIALRLAQDGHHVALNDVPSKRDQLRAVSDAIEKLGRRARVVLGDVSVESEVEGMVHTVAKDLGGLDIMVANAGIPPPLGTLATTEVHAWERVMAVNARGTFLCFKHAARHMIAQGRGGRMVAASSMVGIAGERLTHAYTASKFAIRGLAHAAALELGRYGITVNAYAPGPIDTPMLKHLDGAAVAETALFGSIIRNMSSGGIKRTGQPDDIASIVSYLASEEARFITGQCISVDGGIILT